MSLRAERRRGQREQQRRCLTVADIERLNEQRRRPDDFPLMKNLKPELSPKRRELIAKDINTSTYDDTRELVAFLARSTELQALTARLRSHPGPASRLHPLVLFTAVVLQAVNKGDYLRTEICERINGLDSRLWHDYAMCDKHERTPVTYNMVEQQIRRIEKICGDSVDDAECDFWSRFSSELLGLSIPQARLDKATAVAVDQTAFPTHYRTTDFRRQADVDKAFKATGALPDGVIVDSEQKMVRCKDPDARAGHRSASTAAGGKATPFVGYKVNEGVLVDEVGWSGRPEANPLNPNDDCPPYVASVSVVRASADPGPVCFDLVLSAQRIASRINDVLADRGITNCVKTFNRPLHQRKINVTMDYKNMPRTQISAATKMTLKSVGKRNTQLLYVAMDGLYPLWTPKQFLKFPEGSTEDEARDWYEKRAKYRWVSNGTRPDGRKQFRCPQHAGNVPTTAKTRGRGRPPTKSVVTLHLDPEEYEWCCEGSVMLGVEELDTFQQIPYGTTAHAKSYGRRNQIENVFSIARAHGGFTPHSCRARGLGAHLIPALTIAFASNLHFAQKDPLAEDPTGHANNDTPLQPDDHRDSRDDTAVSGGTTADNRNGRRHRAPP